jgi:hypothetical protein
MDPGTLMQLTGLSYDDWLEHAFGREVRMHGNQWFFDLDSEWWAPTSAEYVAYLTRLFENPEQLMAEFADSQIAQGLTYLVDVGATGDDGHLADPSVPVADRVRLVRATVPLFERLFAKRCTLHLSHLDEPGAGALNGRCYMWWDTFPSLGLAGDPDLPALQDAALTAMEDILNLDSIACQESALHGLSHWNQVAGSRVAEIVDGFLTRTPNGRSELLTYARAARSGCVL